MNFTRYVTAFLFFSFFFISAHQVFFLLDIVIQNVNIVRLSSKGWENSGSAWDVEFFLYVGMTVNRICSNVWMRLVPAYSSNMELN